MDILMFWIAAIVLFIFTGASFADFSTATEKKEKIKVFGKSAVLTLCFLACVVSGLTSCVKSDSQAANTIQILTGIGLVIFCIVQFFISLQAEQDKKDAEAQKKIMAEYEKRKRVEMRAKTIMFGRKNEVDLEPLYIERENYADEMLRSIAFMPVLTYEPTYTRGVVKGSLADNISTLANAQKKRDYEEQQQRRYNHQVSAESAKSSYNQVTQQIIDTLKTIPNSEEYVEYEMKNGFM